MQVSAVVPPVSKPATTTEVAVAYDSTKRSLAELFNTQGRLFHDRHVAGERLQLVAGYSARDADIVARIAQRFPTPDTAVALAARMAGAVQNLDRLGRALRSGPKDYDSWNEDSRVPELEALNAQVTTATDSMVETLVTAAAMLQKVRYEDLNRGGWPTPA